MSRNTEPVNLFDVGGDRFPCGDHLLNSLIALRNSFDTTWPALELLSRHVGETIMGSNHDGTAITDEELAFHQIALDQISDALEELRKKVSQTSIIASRRMWTTITNRGSMGMICFGKTFMAEGELIPKQPKEGTPEHAALMEWAVAEGYAEYIDAPSIGWRSMQKIIDDRAEKHLPLPPHVEISASTSIKTK